MKLSFFSQISSALVPLILNPIQDGVFWNHIGWGGDIVSPPLCFSYICDLITSKLSMLVLWDKISQKPLKFC